MRGRAVCALAPVLLAVFSTVARADNRTDLRREIFTALREDDARRAAEVLEQYLELAPHDSVMLYNATCMQCRLGDLERAEKYLLDAVKAGFINFSQMRRDSDLEPLRGRGPYRAIMAARDAADPILAQRRVDEWRDKYGEDDYRFDTDAERRLNYVTALDDAGHERLRRTVERQADHLAGSLFEAPLPHFVMVAIPTPEDAASELNNNPHIRGVYQHVSRRLIATDLGRSLRHELVHAFHHCAMDRHGQQHPMWVQEGLGCLYEAYRLDDDGSVVFLPNERDLIARTLAREDRLVEWPELFEYSARHFHASPGELYAEVRSIFTYLAEQDRLETWYRTYTEHFDDDPSGARAFELVFARSLGEVEAEWRRWLEQRELVDPVPVSEADEAIVELAIDEAAAEPSTELTPDPPVGPQPARVETAYREARMHTAAGEYEQAIRMLHEVIAIDPHHADAHYDLGLLYVRMENMKAARQQQEILDRINQSLSSLLANLVPR